MRIKAGASIAGIQPETVLGIQVCSSLCLEHGLRFVLTSGTDGKHSRNSLHYVGYAFDARIKDWTPEEVEWYLTHAKDRLGKEWDILLHAGSHVHHEYQPETNR